MFPACFFRLRTHTHTHTHTHIYIYIYIYIYIQISSLINKYNMLNRDRYTSYFPACKVKVYMTAYCGLQLKYSLSLSKSNIDTWYICINVRPFKIESLRSFKCESDTQINSRIHLGVCDVMFNIVGN